MNDVFHKKISTLHGTEAGSEENKGKMPNFSYITRREVDSQEI